MAAPPCRDISVRVTDDQQPGRPVQPKAEPSLFVLAMLVVDLRQESRVEEYRRRLLEGHAMALGVARRLDRVLFKPILESFGHRRIFSRIQN